MPCRLQNRYLILGIRLKIQKDSWNSDLSSGTGIGYQVRRCLSVPESVGSNPATDMNDCSQTSLLNGTTHTYHTYQIYVHYYLVNVFLKILKVVRIG